MSFYEKYILPRFLNCACASEPITYQRKKVVPLAEGKILEVGIGSGLNLPFYNKSKIIEIWGIDPSEELNAMAKRVATEENINVKFITSSAEDIPFPNNYFDTVLITYTMCTIPSVLKANEEMRRVLKSGGKMIFCEHGVSPDESIKKWQKRLNSIWGKIAGGCNINRDIPMLIKSSGFKIVMMDEMYLPKTPKIAGYNYWGYATPE
jgi:ubiquinone/menaquinone biosynthesis C-methylase UbiE